MIITIHPANSDQETAIRMFLDALHVEYNYNTEGIDETEYLRSSPAMIDHLNQSIEQDKQGQGSKVSLDDVWK